jgi:DNA (cytosine-5)-methyltransferase 1
MEEQYAAAQNRTAARASFGMIVITTDATLRLTMNRPLAVDLFCGVGGMALGFEQAGFHVAAAFDSDPLNVTYYRKNFQSTPTFERDISRLSGATIRTLAELGNSTVDLLFGGPPCQGFSEIGKRKESDPRNLLILDFARIVSELKPLYFVLENVPGLLYARSKLILDSFLASIRQAGYNIVEPLRLLDSSQYGVPQKRRRAFLLGYQQNVTPPEYPQIATSLAGNPVCAPTVSQAIGDLPNVGKYDYLLTSDVFLGMLGPPSGYASVLRGHVTDPGDLSQPRARSHGFLSGCLRTIHREETVKRFDTTIPGTYELISRCYRLALDGTAYTLRAGTPAAFGSFTAARPIHPTQPRCITTREAARLHSFPDWFEFHPTKWHGFRQIGNSVPPLFARAVAFAVMQAISATDAAKAHLIAQAGGRRDSFNVPAGGAQ